MFGSLMVACMSDEHHFNLIRFQSTDTNLIALFEITLFAKINSSSLMASALLARRVNCDS
jgi:hypothetical protein